MVGAGGCQPPATPPEFSLSARGGEVSTFDGRDETGKLFAHATNISGRWTIYLTPWACGREGGLAPGPCEDGPAAMDAAARYVAAHLAG